MKLRITKVWTNLRLESRVVEYQKSFWGLIYYWTKLPIMKDEWSSSEGYVFKTEDEDFRFFRQEYAEQWVQRMFTGYYPKFKSVEKYLEKYWEVKLEEERLDRIKNHKREQQLQYDKRVIEI